MEIETWNIIKQELNFATHWQAYPAGLIIVFFLS